MVGQPSPPIVVKIIEEPSHETTIVDVLLGALGLTGVLVLIALLFGVLLGGSFILYRVVQARRKPYRAEAGEEVPHIV
jgi:hypothetical protein